MPSFAMKVFDLQWFTTFGMDYDRAAQALVDDGIDTVLTQNRIDPLPQSGVDQTAYLQTFRDRLATYDDRAWIDALRRHDLNVVQTSAILFDPPALNRFPDARPIDASGNSASQIDWYIGICPSHEGYLDAKLERLRQVDRELSPDGLFLQFMRYPGFWENWTWNPDYLFSDTDRFCFCDRCRTRFAETHGLSLQPGTIADQAREILSRHGDRWTAWRSSVIRDIVARARGTIDAGSRVVMLNTLPFPRSDFNGFSAREEIVAQDLALLSSAVDRFELMTYLQILHRPVEWLRTAIADARSLVPEGRTLLCTLQVDALYIDGIHAARQRPATISADDLKQAANTALDAGIDGLVFYHWTDFLVDEAGGGKKREVLRTVTHD